MLYKTVYLLKTGYYFKDNIKKILIRVLKLGTTMNEARRKWDYETYSPKKPKYVALFRIKSLVLTDNDLYLLDSVHFPNYLKNRGLYNTYRDTQLDGGTEWYYDINLILIIEDFLNYMGYEYELILEDPYLTRPKDYKPTGEEKLKKKAIKEYKLVRFRKKCQRDVLAVCFNEWAEQSYNTYCKKTVFTKLKINRFKSKYEANYNKSLKKAVFNRLIRWYNIQKHLARLLINYYRDVMYGSLLGWRQFIKDNKPIFRPHQVKALEYFKRQYDKTPTDNIVKCLFDMCPGTGKTLVGLEIARLGIKLRNRRGLGWLWIVHMNDISATQRNGDFKDFTNRSGIDILYSCDENLSDNQIEKINTMNKPFILVGSKQLIIDRERLINIKNDIFIGIIVDECRHSTAPKYFEGINSLIKSQSNLRFQIGLDGTPFKEETNFNYTGNYCYDSLSKVKMPILENVSENKPMTNEERNIRLRSMYMEENGEYFSYSYQNAIGDGAIVVPKIIISVCPDINYELISKYIDNKINELGLPYKKGIGWCSDIEQVEESAKKMNISGMEILKTHSGNKDHRISSRQQVENMDKFYKSSGKNIMTTAGRYKEGSNVPKIDFGFNISNQDTIDINAKKQEIARVQRNAPNKDFALYMDFITDDCKYSKVYYRWNIYRQIFGDQVDITIEGVYQEIPSIERIICLNSIREFFSVKNYISNLTTIEIPQNFNEDILVGIYNHIRSNEKRLPALDRDKTVQGHTIIQLFRSILKRRFYSDKNDWKDAIRRLNIKSPEDYISNYKKDIKLALNPQMIYDGFSNLSKEINDVFRSTTVRL